VRLPANLVRDRIDGGRRKRWGAKEHPTLRLAAAPLSAMMALFT
jgi:hypothetical protein